MKQQIVGGIHHHVIECMMTRELVCDEISVGDNWEVRSISIRTHQWVWDSPQFAHTHCGRCHIHCHICANRNDPDMRNTLHMNEIAQLGVNTPSQSTLTTHVGQAPEIIPLIREDP